MLRLPLRTLAAAPMLPVLVIVVVVFSIVTPGYLSLLNFQNLLRDASVLIIAAMGATLVFLVSGLDLSVGSTVAASSVTAAIVAMQSGSLALGLVAGVVVGLAVGLLNGILIGPLGLNPFVITLASLLVVRALAYVSAAVNSGGGGTAGAVPMPDGVASFGRGMTFGVPNVFLVALVVVVLSVLLLERTTFGRRVRLVGQNDIAASFTGISVPRVRLLVYTIAGLLAGLAGIILALRLGSGSPAAGDDILLQVITAVIIGGTAVSGGSGGMVRTVWGALTIVAIERGMSALGLKFYDNLIALGVVILLGTLLHRVKSGRVG